jgi:hypothetical protein
MDEKDWKKQERRRNGLRKRFWALIWPIYGETYCFVHYTWESKWFPRQVCPECGHIYSKGSLWADYKKDCRLLGIPGSATKVEEIYFCPHCVHDF